MATSARRPFSSWDVKAQHPTVADELKPLRRTQIVENEPAGGLKKLDWGGVLADYDARRRVATKRKDLLRAGIDYAERALQPGLHL